MEALIIGARCNEVQGHSQRREAQSFVAERHRRAAEVLGLHEQLFQPRKGTPWGKLPMTCSATPNTTRPTPV
jgi:hypothetical protein